jgi:ferrous iron transport protein B
MCSLEGIADERQRKRAAVLLSFIPCSAMLPLLMLLISSVLKVSFLYIFLVYFLSIAIGLLTCMLCKGRGAGGCPPRDLVPPPTFCGCFAQMEPKPARQAGFSCHRTKRPLLFPNLFRALKNSFLKTLFFAKKISIAFVISAFVITILARFTFDFKFTQDSSNSVLFYICGVLSPLFTPIGLNNPAIICALLFGIIAKESAVSVLLLFPEIAAGMSAATAVSLIAFYTLYPVCVSCCMAVSAHCGKKTMPKLFLLNMAAAYIFSFIVYSICVIISNGSCVSTHLCVII